MDSPITRLSPTFLLDKSNPESDIVLGTGPNNFLFSYENKKNDDFFYPFSLFILFDKSDVFQGTYWFLVVDSERNYRQVYPLFVHSYNTGGAANTFDTSYYSILLFAHSTFRSGLYLVDFDTIPNHLRTFTDVIGPHTYNQFTNFSNTKSEYDRYVDANFATLAYYGSYTNTIDSILQRKIKKRIIEFTRHSNSDSNVSQKVEVRIIPEEQEDFSQGIPYPTQGYQPFNLQTNPTEVSTENTQGTFGAVPGYKATTAYGAMFNIPAKCSIDSLSREFHAMLFSSGLSGISRYAIIRFDVNDVDQWFILYPIQENNNYNSMSNQDTGEFGGAWLPESQYLLKAMKYIWNKTNFWAGKVFGVVKIKNWLEMNEQEKNFCKGIEHNAWTQVQLKKIFMGGYDKL